MSDRSQRQVLRFRSGDDIREGDRVLRRAHDPPHFHVGVTAAADERLADHNAGRCPHTTRYRPWSLHVVIECSDERMALRFERYLKSGSGREFARRHFG